MTTDPILTEEQHDAQMGLVAKGGDWTPLVDHDEALRAERDAHFDAHRETMLNGIIALARADSAEREVARLREALAEYAHHNGACRYSGMHWTPEMVGCGCTCGLDAALATPVSEEDPE